MSIKCVYKKRMRIKLSPISLVKESEYFALQCEDSTDCRNLVQLLVFVRYIGKSDIEEDILFCIPLATNTTGVEVFKVIDGYLKEHAIDWEKCAEWAQKFNL